MALLRRLALLGSMLIGVSATFTGVAISAAAQGPQGFLPAGNYTFIGTRGSFNLFPADPAQTTVNLFISREQGSSMPLVGPTSTSDVTTLNLTVSTNFGFGTPNGNACVLLDNPADFTISPTLQSASLHTTISSTTPTCNGPVSLPTPFTVDVTWTGAGPIQSTHGTDVFGCAGYTRESNSTDTGNAGRASFSMTGLGVPLTVDHQVFAINNQSVHAQGAVPSDACRGGGIGKGAGRPTPAAGNYHVTLQEANIFFSANDGLSVLFLSVDQNAKTASPLGGQATSSNETDLSFFALSPSTNAGGCFVLSNPGDFALTGGLSGAVLHTTLTADTPGCNGQTNNISPLPFAINVAWVTTGPIATTRDDNQFACLDYHNQNSVVTQVDSVASATVSIPGFDLLAASGGSLGTSDARTHADGVAAAGCGFRG